jgi:protein involved in polysaccharide export with SLBB domain
VSTLALRSWAERVGFALQTPMLATPDTHTAQARLPLRLASLASAIALAAIAMSGCSSGGDLPFQPDPVAQPVYTPQQGEYHLVPGDVDFMYHRDLNTNASVLVDGAVNVNGLGEFYASGQTAAQLEETIFRRASLTYRDPIVSVVLVNRQGYRAYVGGEVKRPGYVDIYPGMTSMRAIFERGGFLDTAKTNNVLHVRWDDNGQYKARLVNLEAALETGDLRNDIAMGPNDVVFVPKTRIANANLWVSQYILKLIPIKPPTTKFPEFGGPWGDNRPD